MTEQQGTRTAAEPTAADARTAAERARDAWNLGRPVGTAVDLISASGRRWRTTTRSPAYAYQDRAVVIVTDWPGVWEIGTDVVLPHEAPTGSAA